MDYAYDVFVSYSSRDASPVLRIAKSLRDSGLSVWIDDWFIEPGHNIAERLEAALGSSRRMLFFVSASSVASEWASLERWTAQFRDPASRRRTIIPVLLDDTDPPPFLTSIRHIDARHLATDAIVQQIRRAIDTAEASSTADVTVVLNVAMSIDGFLDKLEDHIVLSNPRDWDEVDELRAWADAILVGANTLRKDNSKLLIRSDHRQRARLTLRRSPHPVKVTVTASGDLDPKLLFFDETDKSRKVVLTTPMMVPTLEANVGKYADVIPVPSEITASSILTTLGGLGTRRLLVEGGTQMATMFLSEGRVDELRVAVAPFFIGELNAPRLVSPLAKGRVFPHDLSNKMHLRDIKRIGRMAVLHYDLLRTDR